MSARRRAADWSAAENQLLTFEADECEATQVDEGAWVMTPLDRSNVLYVVTDTAVRQVSASDDSLDVALREAGIDV